MLSELLLVFAALEGIWGSPSSGDGRVLSDWPCPENTDIYPCTCTSDTTSMDLTIDCSDVTGDNELRNVFQANFPFNDFKELIIKQDGLGPYYLNTLFTDTFGEASFEIITITGTEITTVEEEAFALSHKSLRTMDVSNNRISEFPIETLPNYVKLETFKINNNDLMTLHPIASETLRFIYLGFNTPDNGISPETFSNSPKLEQIYLQNMDITEIPANTFSALRFLEIIDVSGNKLPELLEYAFNTPSRTVKQISLSNNVLTDIHRAAITGITSSANVNFEHNKLTELKKETWDPLLRQVSSSNAIKLFGNPLACGCDLFWLVLDSSLMHKIDSSSECESGMPLHDLPLSFFVDHCPSPATAPLK